MRIWKLSDILYAMRVYLSGSRQKGQQSYDLYCCSGNKEGLLR